MTSVSSTAVEWRVSPSTAVAWFAFAASLAFLVVPVPEGVSPMTMRAAGAAVLAIGLWSTGALPEYLTAIVFFLVATVFSIAPPAVVFSGFQSSALWLIFGGMVLGLAVQRSGLADRFVGFVMRRVSGSYPVYVTALAIAGVLLSLVVPSAMGRVMLLIPIVLAVTERLGFGPGSRGRAGLVLGTALATTLPAFGILPSNVPNLTMAGATESIYGTTFQYGTYLALNFPVLGTLSLIATVVVASVLFGDTPRAERMTGQAQLERWTREERVLLLVLVGTIGLWSTDFLHGIAPAWVALAAAVACLLPRTGVIDARAFVKDANFGPWLYVGGVIGMGAVANHTGLSDLVGGALFEAVDLAPGVDFRNYVSIVGIGMAVSVLTTHPAAPAIMTPLAESFAAATGWPLRDVLMAQVPAWVVFPFPYQVPPVLVAMSLAGVPIRQVARMLLIFFVFGVVAILPLHFLWGQALGYFGPV